MIVVLVLGVVFGLLGNCFSPRGIDLFRNYFSKVTDQPGGTAKGALGAADGRMIGHQIAMALFDSPERLVEKIVFVDVRTADSYALGHVPGSYHFDYYQPAAGLAEVMAACRTAETVVVYCKGGDCEDARLAVALLEQNGIPAGKLRLYKNGFGGWEAAGAPVETGARSSGVLKGGSR